MVSAAADSGSTPSAIAWATRARTVSVTSWCAAGVAAGGAFGGLVLGHAAHRGAEARVLGQFGELDPGLDLARAGLVGEFGHGGAEHRHHVGVGVQAAEGLVDEVVQQAVAFGLGHLWELGSAPGARQRGPRRSRRGRPRGPAPCGSPAGPGPDRAVRGPDPGGRRSRCRTGGNRPGCGRSAARGRHRRGTGWSGPEARCAGPGADGVLRVAVVHGLHLGVSTCWRLKSASPPGP